MQWWWWIILGVVFLAAELFLPGSFVAFFFGIAAICMGVITGIGVINSLWIQWLIFSAVAIITLLFLRKPLQQRLKLLNNSNNTVNSFAGEIALVIEDIPVNGIGRIELRGSSWSARSKANDRIVVGTTCQVESIDGLTVWVKTE
ncbi:MAG: NfeD family protein [Deltaproteobacteria bacterium]|nr:NfeD family protein [Deltaproteobacteria bacterium]